MTVDDGAMDRVHHHALEAVEVGGGAEGVAEVVVRRLLLEHHLRLRLHGAHDVGKIGRFDGLLLAGEEFLRALFTLLSVLDDLLRVGGCLFGVVAILLTQRRWQVGEKDFGGAGTMREGDAVRVHLGDFAVAEGFAAQRGDGVGRGGDGEGRESGEGEDRRAFHERRPPGMNAAHVPGRTPGRPARHLREIMAKKSGVIDTQAAPDAQSTPSQAVGQLSQKVVVLFSEATPSWMLIWWLSMAAMVRPRPR